MPSGKKHRKALESLDKKKLFSVEEGIAKVKELAYARFNESVTVTTKLGINPEKADQLVRGSITLPHRVGEKKRIIAFARGEQVALLQKAGVDMVGSEDLVEKVLGGWMDFDYAVSTPDLMGLVGKTARILGPKGLLPNKKNNTVALDLVPIVKELQQGLLFFKNDKSAQVNFTFGKISQSEKELEENLSAFLKVLSSLKPSTSKGTFVKDLCISSTMGPGIRLQAGLR